QKAQTVQNKTFTVPTATAGGTKFVVDLGFKNIVAGTVNVFNGVGAPVVTSAFTVDYANGLLTYTVPSNTSASEVFAIQFRATFYGTPAGWDYKGATGAIRILLNR